MHKPPDQDFGTLDDGSIAVSTGLDHDQLAALERNMVRDVRLLSPFCGELSHLASTLRDRVIETDPHGNYHRQMGLLYLMLGVGSLASVPGAPVVALVAMLLAHTVVVPAEKAQH